MSKNKHKTDPTLEKLEKKVKKLRKREKRDKLDKKERKRLKELEAELSAKGNGAPVKPKPVRTPRKAAKRKPEAAAEPLPALEELKPVKRPVVARAASRKTLRAAPAPVEVANAHAVQR